MTNIAEFRPADSEDCSNYNNLQENTHEPGTHISAEFAGIAGIQERESATLTANFCIFAFEAHPIRLFVTLFFEFH